MMTKDKNALSISKRWGGKGGVALPECEGGGVKISGTNLMI
jgi:hypothetical protein